MKNKFYLKSLTVAILITVFTQSALPSTDSPIFLSSTTAIDFGEVYAGSMKSDSVLITNAGLDTLDIFSIYSTNHILFSPLSGSFSLLPSESAYVIITFSPMEAGIQSSTIYFYHNAESSPDSLIVSGMSILPIIPDNIFPLTTGNRFDYSGYLTQQDTETPVAGSSSFYKTIWTIGSEVPLQAIFGPLTQKIISAPNGRASATLIFDTTTVHPLPVKKFTPVMVYLDSQSGDYFYLVNLGLFFRTSLIKDSANASGVRADSLRFIKLASPRAGLHGKFIAFEEIFTSFANPSAPMAIKITFVGEWVMKQELMLNGTPYMTYFLLQRRNAYIGSMMFASAVTAKFWFGAGIGPVKMFLAGDSQVSGDYRELISKNFVTTVPKSVDEAITFLLEQNYPNPFNPMTTIRYHLSNAGRVTVKVFDLLGREIASLVDEMKKPGSYTATFNASGLPSGVYFYRLQSGRFSDTKKFLLVK